MKMKVKITEKQSARMHTLRFEPNMQKQYLASILLGLPIDENSLDYIHRQFIKHKMLMPKHTDDRKPTLFRALKITLDRQKSIGKRVLNVSKTLKRIKTLKELGYDSVNLHEFFSSKIKLTDINRQLKLAVENSLKHRAILQTQKTSNEFTERKKMLERSYTVNSVRSPHDTVYPNKRYIGLEVEFITPHDSNFLIDLAKKLKIKNLQVGSDASIKDFKSSSHRGFEIRLLMENEPEYIQSQLKKLCKLLKMSKAYVNKSCGLHVHFDVRNLTNSEQNTLIDRLANSLNVLKSLVPVSRRNNKYCLFKVNKRDSDNREDRYTAINVMSIAKYGTIEVRLHTGTVDFLKMFNWINLLNVILTTKNKVKFKTLDEMIEGLAIPDDIGHFYYERFKKFNPDAGSLDEPLSTPVEEHDINEASIDSHETIKLRSIKSPIKQEAGINGPVYTYNTFSVAT